MVAADTLPTEAPERLIRGADHWWFLGPGGIAKVWQKQLDPLGELLPTAESNLREAGLYRRRDYRVYALTVLTSTDCNLGCGYCFQNTGQDLTGGNRPPRISHARLTSDAIDRILGFVRRQMTAEDLQKLSIMLFGGEPLLNFKGCRELLTRAADCGLVSASMISNGVLLTPLIARELAALGLRSVQITFDGDRDDHDSIRVRRSGGGTFGAIVANVAAASAAADRLRWSLRVNVSHHTHAGVPALISRLAEQVDTARCTIYFARVGDVGVGYGNELLHTGQLATDFISWNRQALELGFQVPRPAARPACQACSYKNGQYGAVVNPDGTLYSCWETSGRPGFEVGSVDDGYLPTSQTGDRWLTCADKYQYADDTAALTIFQDTVDAALLDDLKAAGRL
ncbi:MAG TPA: radical SAM protein [Jatrophihabitans sp.]|jgi:uncharacterized protein|nr:radical SAM protein [Jatrophihabitans sp.]